MSKDRRNMFERTLDRRDIAAFVKEIEKYECLYDPNSLQYANKMLKRRSWLAIANKYKCSVSDCKEKWRKIKIAYMRSLKLAKSGNPPSRPYYLAKYLHFISPDRKVDDNLPTTNSAPSPASSEDSLELEFDDYDHLEETYDDTDNYKKEIYMNTSEKCEEMEKIQYHDQNSGHSDNLSSSNMERFAENVNARVQLDTAPEKCSKTHDNIICLEPRKSLTTDENNPRRMFLLSLLPEIEALNEYEMRTFRREVITLLDNIMEVHESN